MAALVVDKAPTLERPNPIPTDEAATLNRCTQTTNHLRNHANPEYLRTGTGSLDLSKAENTEN